MRRQVRPLKIALVIVGAVILMAGIVGTILVSQAQASATSQMINECFANPASPQCFGLATTVATYGLYWWLTVLLAGVGVIIIIVGLVLAAVSTTPTMPAYMPQPVPSPTMTTAPMAGTQMAPCVRCGRPARWVPAYNRWYYDAEQMYV